MAKMKYWNGSAWVVLDSKNADTVNGKTVETSVPANAKFTDTNTWRPVVNNLTSTATDQSLSAAQGKELKAQIDGKAASSHGTHVSYGTGTTGSTYGGEAAAGTASTVSRSDHKHALPALPTASTSASGIVQLNDATNSASTTQAATANAVKKIADTKVDKTYIETNGFNGTLSSGTVDLSGLTDMDNYPRGKAVHGIINPSKIKNFPISANENVRVTIKSEGRSSDEYIGVQEILGFSNPITRMRFIRTKDNNAWTPWIRQYTLSTFESLGLTDADFSPTDFGENVKKIIGKAGSYSTFKAWVSQPYPNLVASISKDAGIGGTQIYQLEIETSGNTDCTNKIKVVRNSTSGQSDEYIGWYDNVWGGLKKTVMNSPSVPFPFLAEYENIDPSGTNVGEISTMKRTGNLVTITVNAKLKNDGFFAAGKDKLIGKIPTGYVPCHYIRFVAASNSPYGNIGTFIIGRNGDIVLRSVQPNTKTICFTITYEAP